jgi:hypothetical protein
VFCEIVQSVVQTIEGELRIERYQIDHCYQVRGKPTTIGSFCKKLIELILHRVTVVEIVVNVTLFNRFDLFHRVDTFRELEVMPRGAKVLSI